MLFLSRKRSRSRRLRICKNICNTFGLLLTFFKNDFGCLKTLYEKYMICVCFVTRNLTEKLRTDIAIIISIAALVNVCKKWMHEKQKSMQLKKVLGSVCQNPNFTLTI